jgi:hypothetical protein
VLLAAICVATAVHFVHQLPRGVARSPGHLLRQVGARGWLVTAYLIAMSAIDVAIAVGSRSTADGAAGLLLEMLVVGGIAFVAALIRRSRRVVR